VEMHGRLRLDKLAKYIECFLKEPSEKSTQNTTQSSADAELSVASSSRNEASGPVYFSPPPEKQDLPTEQELQDAIEAAVPLTKVLESSGKLFSLGVSGGSYLPLSRHLSLPPTKKTPPPPISVAFSMPNERLHGPPPQISLQRRILDTVENEGGTLRRKRLLINRPASSDLDRIESDQDDDNGDMTIEYVTLDMSPGDDSSDGVIPLIPFDELMLIEMLGAGRVSTIYRAVWQRPFTSMGSSPIGTNMLALKVAMVNPETFDTSRVDELRREADIAARLHHPNICDLIGIAADSE
jgi:hypothetical protein